MGMLEPARIREETLESDNLFSGSWIPPPNRTSMMMMMIQAFELRYLYMDRNWQMCSIFCPLFQYFVNKQNCIDVSQFFHIGPA